MGRWLLLADLFTIGLFPWLCSHINRIFNPIDTGIDYILVYTHNYVIESFIYIFFKYTYLTCFCHPVFPVPVLISGTPLLGE